MLDISLGLIVNIGISDLISNGTRWNSNGYYRTSATCSNQCVVMGWPEFLCGASGGWERCSGLHKPPKIFHNHKDIFRRFSRYFYVDSILNDISCCLWLIKYILETQDSNQNLKSFVGLNFVQGHYSISAIPKTCSLPC